MGKVMYMRKGEVHSAPKIPGIELSTLAEGSIVKLNENGSPVEFYVAKHNYEQSLNGAGRTLLVRKECYNQQYWNSTGVNTYATSSIDAWLNETYKGLLASAVQRAIGTTAFYYTPGNGDENVTTLSRSVFLMSVAEITWSTNWDYFANMEGTSLPIESLEIGTINGSAIYQWTRTPYKGENNAACYFAPAGGCGGYAVDGKTMGIRPCITLPSTTVFNEETLIFGS